MIDKALELLRARLNAHLNARFNVPDDLVSLGGVPRVGDPTNMLRMSVVNIVEDTVVRGSVGAKNLGGRVVRKNPPVHLDLYVMLAADYDEDIYSEGLKLISAGMIFFQENAVFTAQNTPELPKGLSQLSVGLESLSVTDQAAIWSMLGGRHVPSVLYRVRGLVIDADVLGDDVPIITTGIKGPRPDSAS